ncbi:MAG: holo-ACP synthase [Chitinispirillales bacterium]|jgi:holo-[acyl-carrier protein] synthase|nr:holo-ACP synthase [Chitinispirillales bacterium]
MAIIGIGIDIAEISRVAGAVARHGDRFVRRIYTPLEADFCNSCAGTVSGSRFAGRWSAKEAFYKALPPDVQPFASWLSVQIVSEPAGRPRIDVRDERLKRALNEVGVSSIHLSITHERTHCAAVAVLEGF